MKHIKAILYIYYIPIYNTTFELSVFWPSDTESWINELSFFYFVSLSFKLRLTLVSCFCGDVKLISSMEPEIENMMM